MATKPKRSRGRPKTEIDKNSFEKLCGLQCTLIEIASFFKCSEDTIENWCKREYKMIFSDVYKVHSAKGKISLRRTQLKLAERSAAMAIFLGKQMLNQRDINGVELSGVNGEPIEVKNSVQIYLPDNGRGDNE